MKPTAIELAICTDYLEKFSTTINLSRYSPSISAVKKRIKLCYSDLQGGIYNISDDDLIEAARHLGLQIGKIGNELRLGIKAEEFNKASSTGVFSDSVICNHGYCQYSIVLDHVGGQPIKKSCCKNCLGGFVAPSEFEIRIAKDYLLLKKTGITPKTGALILAARELGCRVTRTSYDEFKIGCIEKHYISISPKKAVSNE